MTIPLHGRGATIVSSDIDGVRVNQVGDIRTSLETPFTSRAIGLVKGGWLPSALAGEDDTIVLPDRCVVAELKARRSAILGKSSFSNPSGLSSQCRQGASFAYEVSAFLQTGHLPSANDSAKASAAFCACACARRLLASTTLCGSSRS